MPSNNLPQGPAVTGGRQAVGRALGKSINIALLTSQHPGANPVINNPVDFLQLQLPEAKQLSLTISPIKISIPTINNLPQGSLQDFRGPYQNPDQVTKNDDPNLASSFVTVEWGIGGINNTAEIDVLNGLCINLCADFVRATASIESQINAIDAVYQLAAFIGEGYPKSNNAQRTAGFAFLDANNRSSVFAVPKFSKSVTVCGAATDGATPPTPYSSVIEFWRSWGGIADDSPVATYAFSSAAAQKVDIPNGAYYFTTFNAAAVQIQTFAIFDLAI